MKYVWVPLLALATAQVASAQETGATSCLVCHADSDLFDAASLDLVREFENDVHAAVDLSCEDCHGGDPDVALADDPMAAMDQESSEHPYRGVPSGQDVPSFCGRCHSDAEYMRRFKPDARVDQEQEYWTSQHGRRLRDGDTAVATCIDCHTVHRMRRPTDPESSVYPTRVAETCRTCHGLPEQMAGRTLADGRPMPVDQFARWRRSVHADAMFDREDLTAPTCNDCHGNHGATPPEIDSVTFVCGQCHGREADLFRQSRKHAGFEAHNEYLLDAGEERCAACHEEPQASITSVSDFAECTSCHGNHGIVRPTVAMFSALPEAPCAFCHEATEALADGLEPQQARSSYEEMRNQLLAAGQAEGLEEEDLFNWLVDAALALPSHSLEPRGAVDDPPRPRPEFERLFSKFRIGKTYYTYDDPTTGEPVRAEILRCGSCHGSGAVFDEDRPGATTGTDIVARMRELTERTARAERLVLTAKRGGVETREALLDIDQALDSQIGLQVLVHTFSTGDDSAFASRYSEGMEHADAAVNKGQDALGELTFRRQGLAVSLVAIVVLLIALGLKINQISAQEQSRAARRP